MTLKHNVDRLFQRGKKVDHGCVFVIADFCCVCNNKIGMRCEVFFNFWSVLLDPKHANFEEQAKNLWYGPKTVGGGLKVSHKHKIVSSQKELFLEIQVLTMAHLPL